MATMLLGVFAAAGAVVMLLWNWLMPTLFTGVNPVNYGQALGLLLLGKIFLGGPFHGHGHGCGRMHSHRDGMSAEEREHIRNHFRRHWGDCGPSSFDENEAARTASDDATRENAPCKKDDMKE